MRTMWKRLPYFLLPFVIWALTLQAWAQPKAWEDSAELSYVQTGGNTDVLTFSAKNKLTYNFSEKWSGMWKVGILYGETDGVKNAERYNTDLRTDYKPNERHYYYAMAGWFQDKFAGIDNRYYLGPGAGYRLLNGERNILDVEAGLNYAMEDYTDDTRNDFLEGRGFTKYEFVFNPKTRFSQSLEYLHNFDDGSKYRINTVTALTTALTEMFSLKVSYEINYNNKPTPESLKQTDTVFAAALVVNL